MGLSKDICMKCINQFRSGRTFELSGISITSIGGDGEIEISPRLRETDEIKTAPWNENDETLWTFDGVSCSKPLHIMNVSDGFQVSSESVPSWCKFPAEHLLSQQKFEKDGE